MIVLRFIIVSRAIIMYSDIFHAVVIVASTPFTSTPTPFIATISAASTTTGWTITAITS